MPNLVAMSLACWAIIIAGGSLLVGIGALVVSIVALCQQSKMRKRVAKRELLDDERKKRENERREIEKELSRIKEKYSSLPIHIEGERDKKGKDALDYFRAQILLGHNITITLLMKGPIPGDLQNIAKDLTALKTRIHNSSLTHEEQEFQIHTVDLFYDDFVKPYIEEINRQAPRKRSLDKSDD